MATKEQINAAYEEVVRQRVRELQAAVAELAEVHTDGNVGLIEWIESIDNVLFDITDELNSDD